MQTNFETSRTSKLVMTAMTMCMIMVAIFLFRIPIPFTQGYVNLSDAVIFIGILVLGVRYGAIAAALGSMLGDIIGGFAMWAPWTFCIKGGMAIIAGLLIASLCRRKDLTDKKFTVLMTCDMIAGGLFMTFGYYVAEGIMYGSWVVAALGIPWNIGQFCVGIVLALVLTESLKKTSFRKYFIYRRESLTNE